MHEQTRRNLIASLQASSMAHATYLLYAEHTRAAGAGELARLFERMAADEFRHFAAQADLIDFGGSDEDKLRSALESEHYQANTLLGEYATKATTAGDAAAAAVFTRLREDRRGHERALRRALADALAPRTTAARS